MKKVLALALALVLALGCASFAMAEEEKPLIGILAPATTHGWVAAWPTLPSRPQKNWT